MAYPGTLLDPSSSKVGVNGYFFIHSNYSNLYVATLLNLTYPLRLQGRIRQVPLFPLDDVGHVGAWHLHSKFGIILHLHHNTLENSGLYFCIT